MKRQLKQHLVDSTAILAVTHPIIAGLQTLVAGVSDYVSLKNRLYTTALTYGGLGRVFSYFRDKSRSIFKVDDSKPEWIQQLHDASCNAAFNVLIAPPLLVAAGETDLEKIVTATALQAGYGFISGGPIGYSIDTARDLTGIQSSERVPNFVKYRTNKIKRSLAALLVATSIGITGTIYSLPNRNLENQPKIEQTYIQDDK